MSKVPILKHRARMLSRVRAFFSDRSILEVDTPLLSHTAPIDTYIEVMRVAFQNGSSGYLHTSPEYAMKRLLALGSGDIYQLSHVFREGEVGRLHNPEFTMIEWYRLGIELSHLIVETIELIHLFIGSAPVTTYTYAEAFLKFVGIDYLAATPADLKVLALEKNLPLPHDPSSWEKETYLHFMMGFLIEPQLQGLTVIYDFPASQAALAQLVQREDVRVAERFEVYYHGIELANGFHELTDPLEQRRRFEKANHARQSRGKPPLPLDEKFLAALDQGLPDCCGVAVGFDRLLMLQLQQDSLATVMPFSWESL